MEPVSWNQSKPSIYFGGLRSKFSRIIETGASEMEPWLKTKFFLSIRLQEK